MKSRKKDEKDDERVKEELGLKPHNIQRREFLSSASTGNKMLDEMQRASEKVVCSGENVYTLEAVVASKNDKVYATHFTINHSEIRPNTVQVTEKITAMVGAATAASGLKLVFGVH